MNKLLVYLCFFFVLLCNCAPRFYYGFEVNNKFNGFYCYSHVDFCTQYVLLAEIKEDKIILGEYEKLKGLWLYNFIDTISSSWDSTSSKYLFKPKYNKCNIFKKGNNFYFIVNYSNGEGIYRLKKHCLSDSLIILIRNQSKNGKEWGNNLN